MTKSRVHPKHSHFAHIPDCTWECLVVFGLLMLGIWQWMYLMPNSNCPISLMRKLRLSFTVLLCTDPYEWTSHLRSIKYCLCIWTCGDVRRKIHMPAIGGICTFPVEWNSTWHVETPLGANSLWQYAIAFFFFSIVDCSCWPTKDSQRIEWASSTSNDGI